MPYRKVLFLLFSILYLNFIRVPKTPITYLLLFTLNPFNWFYLLTRILFSVRLLSLLHLLLLVSLIVNFIWVDFSYLFLLPTPLISDFMSDSTTLFKFWDVSFSSGSIGTATIFFSTNEDSFLTTEATLISSSAFDKAPSLLLFAKNLCQSLNLNTSFNILSITSIEVFSLDFLACTVLLLIILLLQKKFFGTYLEY